jgi:hypothetical protein
MSRGGSRIASLQLWLKKISAPHCSPGMIGARRIDVDINLLDTSLRLGVAQPGVPGSIAEPSVADL